MTPSGEFDDEPGAEDEGGFGWVSPESRAWRHPSETGPFGPRRAGPPPPRSARLAARAPVPGRNWKMALSAAALGAALATGALVLADWAVAGTPAALFGGARMPHTKVALSSKSYSAHAGGGQGRSRLSNTGRASSQSPAMVRAGAAVMQEATQLRDQLVALQASGPSGTTWGTGLVVREGGLVLTSDSLILRGQHIVAITAGNQREKATVLASDANSGVAILRIGQSNLTPASLIAASNITPGQLAIAVTCKRSPESLDIAVGRITQISQHASLQGGSVLIDTLSADAPVSTGAAGGLLLNGNGHVIAILDAVQHEGPNAVDIGTPAEIATTVASELMTRGKVVHGWLGIEGHNAPAPATGAIITAVGPNSPAANAGLHPGDIIEAVNGISVSSMAALQGQLYLLPPKVPVVLEIDHGGVTTDVKVVLSANQ